MRKLVMLLLGVLLCYGQLLAQNRVITGKVLDANGNPVPNASILIKGTSTGTSSGMDGSFSISVPPNARTLVISSVGLQNREVSIPANQQTLSISLGSSDKTLDEVIVTGVGAATSRKKVAISVESVTAKDLPKVPQGSIDQALVGKIAGAQISSISGQPGQQAGILLRGINTLGTTQPMILVDGVQINAGNNSNGSGNNLSSRLSDLDLSNVERVEVVQGAAAATIYGAQGANGVIQIFTKKGARNGKTSISFNSRVSFDNVLTGNLKLSQKHFYDTDAQGFIVSNQNVRLTPNSQGLYPAPKLPTSLVTAVNDKTYQEQTYDNLDAVFKNNAATFNNSITISGGREKFDFAMTLSHLNQESIFNGNYKRTNVSLNIGAELFKNFNVRSITQLIYSDNETGGINGANNIFSPLATTLLTRRYLDLTKKDSIGNYIVNPTVGETSVNPFYTRQFRNWRAENTRLVQNFNLNYKPFPFLEIDYKFGLDNYRFDFQDKIAYQQATLTPTLGITPVNGRLTYDRDNQTFRNSLLSVFLRADLERDFNINVPIASTTQISYDYRKDLYKNVVTQGTGFTPFPPNNLNGTTPAISESQTEKVTFGYLINQKFDWGELFGVSGGVRVDYSSAFGAGSDAFVFPRGDAYFRMSELFTSNIIADWKFRGAYGKAGIQPGAYDRFITLLSGNIGTDGYLALRSVANNPLLNVEVSEEKEIGTDISFRFGNGNAFRNVRLSATYWDKTSEDVIREIDVSPSTGGISSLNNALSLKSNGFQASLDADLVNSKNITWDFGIRFGSSRSMVDKIAGGKDIAIGSGGSGQFVLREGASIGAFFGLMPLHSVDQTTSKGVRYIAADQTGNFEVVNGMVVNKTTKAVSFTTEQQNIGDPNPKFNMTFLNNFTLFNNLSISTQLDWVYGNDIYNQTKQWLYRDYVSGDFDNPVTINGESKAFVNFYNSLYNTNITNSYFVEKGSFLRMRDITLSYQFRDIISKKLSFITNAQFSVGVRNLFTISDYSGMDPEASASLNNPLRRGLDLHSFPNFRTFQAGLVLGF